MASGVTIRRSYECLPLLKCPFLCPTMKLTICSMYYIQVLGHLVVFIKQLFWYYILTLFFPGYRKSEKKKNCFKANFRKEFAQLLLKIVVMKLNSAFVKLNMFVMTFKKIYPMPVKCKQAYFLQNALQFQHLVFTIIFTQLGIN